MRLAFESCLWTMRCAKFQRFVGPNVLLTLAWGNSRRYTDIMNELIREMVG
jgi:hypothetical protein